MGIGFQAGEVMNEILKYKYERSRQMARGPSYSESNGWVVDSCTPILSGTNNLLNPSVTALSGH